MSGRYSLAYDSEKSNFSFTKIFKILIMNFCYKKKYISYPSKKIYDLFVTKTYKPIKVKK